MLKRTVLMAFPLSLVSLTMCGTSSNSGNSGDDRGRDATSSSSGGGNAGSSGGSSGSSGGSGGSSSGGSSASSSGGVDAGPPVGASVLMYHQHINRDGFFVDPKITAAAAAGFARDTTFDGTVNDSVYASPLYVENGVGGKGTFYVPTEGNNLYALDETTGKLAWSKAANFGKPANRSGAGCGNISPIGISGTPAIDLATRLIVFSAASADSNGNIATHTIYGVSIEDGSTQWSVDVSTLKDSGGRQFSPQPQNQRSAVLIVNGIAYVPYGGHAGDCGNYHGWVVGVPLNGKGAKAWATQVGGAGIWAAGGAASDGQSIFVATGNGFDQNATWAQSEGVFRFDPGPSFTGQTADYFAPNNWQSLDQADVDIDGSGPLVIDAPSMTPSKLVMAEGKDGYLYLMDRMNLGGITSAPNTANVGALHVSTGEISNGSAFATVGGTTYVVSRPNGNAAADNCPAGGGAGALVAVKLDPTAPSKMTVVWCSDPLGSGSPIITSSNGTNDPLVWVAGGDSPDETKQLHAFDLLTGKVVFAGGGKADAFTTTVHHFGTLAAVHGRIFATGDGTLYAFK
jgi:hypothetical protein